MQTCTVFATYTNWLSRELEKADPDLSGTQKPPNMTEDQWRHFQSIRSQKTQPSQATQAQAQNADPNSSALQPPPTEGTGAGEEARIAELFDVMRKWETNFSRHLQILLDALNHDAATETVVLLSLCARLSTANKVTDYAGMRGEDEGGF
jgi:gamma-tubulin complex component 2